MALVNVVNMVVLDNPTCFLNPFQFEITFECLQELEDDLEWKVLYVGSAHDSHQDQVLDEILVGPVPVGLNKFVLQADPPDPAKLPPDEVLGVTVVLVTCSYREKEFVRIGFYVNNEYVHPDYLASMAQLQQQQPQQQQASNGVATPVGGGEGVSGAAVDAATNENAANAAPATAAAGGAPATEKPPLPVYPNLEMTYVQRHILADKPRITKFPISWGNEAAPTTDTSDAMMTSAARGFGDNNNDDPRVMAPPTPSPMGADPLPPSPMSPMTTSMDVLMEG